MNPQARQRSVLLEEASRAIAEWTVEAHAQKDDTLAARFGPKWRAHWSAEVQQRLRSLAAALAVESMELFVDAMCWARTGFASRDVPVDDLRTSLECLEEVVSVHLPPAVAGPATAYIAAALGRLDDAPESAAGPDDEAGIDRARLARFTEAALAGRRRDAEALAIDAMDRGESIGDLFAGLLQPFLVEIGSMWHRNEITVADEHASTAVAESVMSVLRSRVPGADPREHRVVATAIAGELHALGVRMVADLFELDGWQVCYLGANTPHEDIIHALRSHEAHLLAASVSSLLNLRALGDLIDTVRAQDDLRQVKILAGGRPLMRDEQVWKRLGADGFAATAAEAIRVGTQLVAGS